jgi:hypothetical protein
MSGCHEGAVRVADRDGVGGWAKIEDGCIDGTEVGSTASVGNSGGGNVGRTGRQGRTYRLKGRGRRREQARGGYTFTGATIYRLPSLSRTRWGSASGATHDGVVAAHEVVGNGGILVAGRFAVAGNTGVRVVFFPYRESSNSTWGRRNQQERNTGGGAAGGGVGVPGGWRVPASCWAAPA